MRQTTICHKGNEQLTLQLERPEPIYILLRHRSTLKGFSLEPIRGFFNQHLDTLGLESHGKILAFSMPINVWVYSVGGGLHVDLSNRNRIPQAGTRGWRQRAACTKRAISIALPLCPSSPLEVPQASLRDPCLNLLGLLWEVCTSQWMNPVSFITRGSRHHCETKQNWKNNTLHIRPISPTLFIPLPPLK